MAPTLLHRQKSVTGRGPLQMTRLLAHRGNHGTGRLGIPSNSAALVPRSPILVPARGFPPNAQSTYSGVTNTVRQAALEEEEYIGRSRDLHYPPDGPFVDEYDDAGDMGFWKVDIEDQAAFICNELDLSDEQALYLLHALGLLPEGATLDDFRDPNLQQELGSLDQEGDPQLRDALESWQDGSDEEEAQAGSWHSDEGAAEDAAARSAGGESTSEPYYDSGSHHHHQHHHHAQHHHHDRHGHHQEAHEDGIQDFGHAAPSAVGPPMLGPSFQVSIRPNLTETKPSGLKVAPGVPAMAYDQASFDQDFEVIQLRVIGRRASTAAAMGDEIELLPGKLIAGRYQVLEQVGAAAFSRAVQAYDTLERRLVCLKVVKNDKECMDACLEEVRLLQMVNARDPHDQHHIARLYDYFYHMGHLFLVVELLGGNLFDTQCYDPSYFTAGRMQSIARQVLQGLAFLHANHVIHADVKPENILVKNYSKCSVKLIDLGCSIYNSEAHMSHYVQSRSYRAPEVMLGLPYDGRIDVWSLGCVMAELATGQVLFPNVSEAAMMARMVGMLGEFPPYMLEQGQYAGAFFTRSGRVYERNAETGLFELLAPKRTTLQARVTSSDRGMLHFIRHLLVPDPDKRPTAAQALKHPWLQYRYRSPK
ncbi:hypothetical protein PLESTB_001091300 [Pleodorina starrii]|uniref:Protein kinase domain-containing protein n=1 Tax=Pleodorina starrii TaxID=330485 RepID=A0A9W6BQC5_9CHLO|nr:hypothetical protein PLESTM_000695100 [Pleodorina starrii]GLC56312.1 hypothetical protein PLESTB_001091300 [Pleodorina starrii]GLC69656.1 hypothetical protein PLESTF_000859600 [Pleodorina starrii]